MDVARIRYSEHPELYAGAGERERRVVERLEHDFDKVKRILVPNLSDWTQTGRVRIHLKR
jgi:hypothetical protein